MSGDIDLNPGPTNEVLVAIKDLEGRIEYRHTEVMSTLNEVKASQKLFEEPVLDINLRLAAVEEKVATLEVYDTPDVERLMAEAVKGECASLQSRLDDYEDRSSRDNLIFHGINDNPEETWAQSEEKVRSILTELFLEANRGRDCSGTSVGQFCC